MPCYKTGKNAFNLATECLKYVDKVICVDDNCPQKTGRLIDKLKNNSDICVLYHTFNKGVGGATKTGIQYALDNGAEIVIKIDSDGQMPPALIPKLVKPIVLEMTEFTKGNRFRSIEVFRRMPIIRLFGNIGLSFLTKLSTGYWELFDPTNGFLAIHKDVLKKININKLDNRYFFETDLLFRCSLSDILISEISMDAIYKGERSNMSPILEISNFFLRHLTLIPKRIFYQYFLLDFNPGSISILISFVMGLSAFTLGISSFVIGTISNEPTELGIQILFLVLAIISSQFFINFIYYDSSQKPMMRKYKLIKN